jgi:hypothetical protein
VCLCRGVTGYLKKLKEFLNFLAWKKAEEEDGIGYSRMCVCLCRGVTGYLKKLKEFLNSPAGKKAEEEDGIGYSRMCVSVQRRDGVPEEAEGVLELPGGEEGGGRGWNRFLKDVCVCAEA